MKHKNISYFLLLVTTVTLVGCAGSSKTIIPAKNTIDITKKLCITPDNSPRKEAYNRVLEAVKDKGFTDVEERTETNIGNCDYILSCQSVSRWDLSRFTSQIHLKLYEKGDLISQADYVQKNNLNLNKFINTKDMINNFLNQMMPNTKKLNNRYEKQIQNNNESDFY